MVKQVGIYIGLASLALFLVLNIALSQIISPLYVNLVRNEREYMVEFLTDIKPLPVFSPKLSLYEDLYGEGVEVAVFAEEQRRNNMINKLERILVINPSSRDTLYNLFLLYKQRDDLNTANVYFERAQNIDPALQ
ncbi:hypothetical protein A3G67_00625 [Candidatus Roizmanbacteria bacterium RIFCSPLOWO2_12_FULL_40_12]|uniref:Uncharacterized protein n=1 Tax=Candidatus Roizmanbacteria bacterium RIFCSPLOWO2_01_FULL_40_42 TaxID=1802066 RepID=A0A1F7J675_9BACT|nr:MAG: hypothetical protein A2779_02105 [Candidatus Roizmanbacteria bacterium RIFCSPHIGHO2_01_FULL_40_98]OGK28784.1 MAG: hypothetical protein A3C31_04025 [Candidatus Roizmanbacteria bacterium RIFCSPHIGHO2_02_FULL_40_53]OGK29642.1 MAG: hypothetical protein A2W49_00420 [Candidatus Roizmanbacteria bacterium RIFCSPHIGHO2_12_41_18]OGK36323.1 MAG: hypothetical protein A3E69_02760 [Candidatus Roizmanbacteria bacterium RIFCSPHIGHO2_12_FULL_40_130]OGK51125.1 MAG: hypothetical protein A3B50_05000 [Candi